MLPLNKKSLLPPLLAFALAELLILLAAHFNGFDPFEPATWFRSDSANYFSIATTGYELHPYTGPAGIDTGPWDGNAGWMPLYPWIIRTLLSIGLPPAPAMLAPVLLFNLLTLILLWNRFLKDVPPPRAFACLLLAAFFPSQVYQSAAFPISLLMFLSVLCLDRFLAQQWWAAAIAGLLAAMSYATGFLLAPILLMFLLLPPQDKIRPPKIFFQILAGIAPLAGLALVCLVDQITVGKWNAFFLVQSKFGHGLHNPLATLHTQITSLLNAPPSAQIFRENILPQIIAVSLLTIMTLIYAALRWPKLSPLDRLLALFAAAFWIFPLIMGMGVMPLRAHACLLPAIPLARKLPLPLQITLLLLFVFLSTQTSKMFFHFPTL